jgi:hypothetical protein
MILPEAQPGHSKLSHRQKKMDSRSRLGRSQLFVQPAFLRIFSQSRLKLNLHLYCTQQVGTKPAEGEVKGARFEMNPMC